MCTFVNHEPDTACTLCLSPRPAAAPGAGTGGGAGAAAGAGAPTGSDDVGYTDEAAVEGIVDAPPLFDDSGTCSMGQVRGNAIGAVRRETASSRHACTECSLWVGFQSPSVGPFWGLSVVCGNLSQEPHFKPPYVVCATPRDPAGALARAVSSGELRSTDSGGGGSSVLGGAGAGAGAPIVARAASSRQLVRPAPVVLPSHRSLILP